MFYSLCYFSLQVKSVNRKMKKASILFIDDQMTHKKKGYEQKMYFLFPVCAADVLFPCTLKDESTGLHSLWWSVGHI